MTDPDEQNFDRLAQRHRQDFNKYLGHEFRCNIVVDVFTLQEAVDLSRPNGPYRERLPFALRFRHPELLPQRVYPLHHDHFGTLPIFLVPIGQFDDGFAYEAVFH